MQKILLLEDDAALGSGIQLALQSPDVQITLCITLAQARLILTQSRFDLLILDINLPDGSGLELLREVRKTSQTPVIFLTANDVEMDIVTGLESGADDYITKPFSLAVLRAIVHAQLRGYGGSCIGRCRFTCGEWRIRRHCGNLRFRNADSTINWVRNTIKMQIPTAFIKRLGFVLHMGSETKQFSLRFSYIFSIR